jgi:telomere length regulation protein
MDSILTPVSTTYKTQGKKDDALIELVKRKEPDLQASFRATTPSEALEVLKHEPDHDALIQTLRFLGNGGPDFVITSPNPIASQLVHVLVTEILPSYWSVLSAENRSAKTEQKKSKQSTELELLLRCLRSVTGLNALLLALKRNIQISKDSKKSRSINVQEILAILLQALEALLEGSTTIERIWRDIWESSDSKAPRKATWAEFLGLVGGGKLLGSAAEAEDVVNSLGAAVGKRHWIGNGNMYGTWLAMNIRHWARNIRPESKTEWKCCAELLTKSFRLGTTGA